MARKYQTLTALFDAIAGAIRGKTGGTTSIVADDFPEAISGISTGIELPTLTTPAGGAQILEGYEAIDGTGAKITGSIPDVVQATPSITVSDKGLITAATTQSAGYVAAGKKSATKQLTAQAAQTITPGTTDQTIASGQYLTGAQTIKGDANLIPANIKSGVSIFGVSGSTQTTGTCTVVVVNESAQELVLRYLDASATFSHTYIAEGATGSATVLSPTTAVVTTRNSGLDRTIRVNSSSSEFDTRSAPNGFAYIVVVPSSQTIGQVVIEDY